MTLREVSPLGPPGSYSTGNRTGSFRMGASEMTMVETISRSHAVSVGPYRTSVTPITVDLEPARCISGLFDVVIAVAGWDLCTD
jgi:hypothetical protein